MPRKSHSLRWARAVVAAACLSAVCVCFAVEIARAAPPASESRDYQRAIHTAVAEFDAGNFPEARALFTRAHQLFPNARTYRGLGFVAFELRNYRDSVAYLEAALRSTEKALDGDTRRSTEDLLGRAKGMIGNVELQVTPSAESVLLDGVPIALTEAKELVLEVGDHVLEVRTPGYLAERRTLKIAGGEQLRVAIQMKSMESEQTQGPRIVASAATDSSNTSDRPPEKRWVKSPWLWTAVAVVVIGAGVGTFFLLRDGERSTRTAAPTMTDNTPPDGVLQALGSF